MSYKGGLSSLEKLYFDNAFMSRHSKEFELWMVGLLGHIFDGRQVGGQSPQSDGGADYIAENIGCEKIEDRWRRIFQVYAPSSPKGGSASSVIAKINRDFEKAQKWKYLKRWTFISKSKGFDEKVMQHRDSLSINSNIPIDLWGQDEVFEEVFSKIKDKRIRERYSRDIMQIDFSANEEAVLQILRYLNSRNKDSSISEIAITLPPKDKLSINNIDQSSAEMLGFARRLDAHVDFLAKNSVKPREFQLAADYIRDRYVKLQTEGLDPGGIIDSIISELTEAFRANGERDYAYKFQQSAWAVFSYFFYRCEIFEATKASVKNTAIY